MEVKLSIHSNWLSEAGYSLEEEKELYNRQLEEIINNPGWYLENLQFMVEYRCNFIGYKYQKRKSL